LTFWNFEDKIHLNSDLFKDFSALRLLMTRAKHPQNILFIEASQPARTDRLMFAGPLVSATTTEMR
jgi:hypothetical protein